MNAPSEMMTNNTTAETVALNKKEEELYHMSALITVNGYELQEINGEAVIKDVVLAERLGYKNARDIRQLIKRMIELGNFGDALPYSVEEKPQSGGHTVVAYYLNEKQALKVISKSETKNANDIMDQVLDVFIAWRNGKLQNNSLPDYPTLLRQHANLIEEKAMIEMQRDNAINTKAEIGSRREATAMATASTATRKVNQLEIELDRSNDYSTIRKQEIRHHTKFAWRPLKKYCLENGLTIKVVDDDLYENVKSYPAQAWIEVHSIDLYEYSKTAISA